MNAVDSKISSMYEKVGYLEMYGRDLLYTFLLFAFTLFIVSIQTYYAIMNELKSNWNKHKCNPVVMPFAGLIMPVPGQTSAETAFENFNYCIYQDISEAFKIIMMPFYFILFLTIGFLDVILVGMTQTINELHAIKEKLGGIFEEIYSKLVNFIVPVIEITIQIRSILDKINGVLTTVLYSVFNLYNLTISGVINLLTVLVILLGILIGIIIYMMILASLLFLSPFTFPVGIALQIIFVVVIAGVILPALIICALMNAEIKNTFGHSSPSPPNPP